MPTTTVAAPLPMRIPPVLWSEGLFTEPHVAPAMLPCSRKPRPVKLVMPPTATATIPAMKRGIDYSPSPTCSRCESRALEYLGNSVDHAYFDEEWLASTPRWPRWSSS
jgi:hypothetical protein